MFKLFKVATLILVLIPCLSFGESHDTISNQELPKYSSINLQLGGKIGYEIAPSIKLEYENKKWGKIMMHGELGVGKGVYKNSAVIADFGLGYGYPIIHTNSKAVYFNSYLTYYSLLGLFETDIVGPSAMFELEYRKTWKPFSISIAPYFRQQLLYSIQEYKYNHDLSHNILDYTIGVSLGFSANIPIYK